MTNSSSQSLLTPKEMGGYIVLSPTVICGITHVYGCVPTQPVGKYLKLFLSSL